MVEFHLRFCGGHFATNTTTHKIPRAGYYWPILFLDMHKFVRSCPQCDLFTGKQTMKALPLHPIVTQAPFQQWGLDFIGKFKDNSSNGSIDYFTKWLESIPTNNETNDLVMEFLEDKIITIFGVPAKIITNNGPTFSSSDISSFCFKYDIFLSH